MGSQYERELRHVLAGVEKGVNAVIRSCDEMEKQGFDWYSTVHFWLLEPQEVA